jgi:hypothetical protein
MGWCSPHSKRRISGRELLPPWFDKLPRGGAIATQLKFARAFLPTGMLEYLSDETNAQISLCGIKKLVGSLRKENNYIVDTKEIHQVDNEHKLMLKGRFMNVKQFGLIGSISLTNWYLLMPVWARNLWKRMLLNDLVNNHLGSFDLEDLKTILSQVSTHCNKYGNKSGCKEAWRYGVGLYNIFPFRHREDMQDVEVAEYVSSWFGKLRKQEEIVFKGDRQLYLSKFRQKVRNNIYANVSDYTGLLVDEYYSDPGNWATTGATHVKYKILKEEEKLKVLPGGKLVFGGYIGWNKIRHYLHSYRGKPTINMFFKEERKKLRGIAGLDEITHLREIGPMQCYMNKMRGRVSSPIWMGTTRYIEFEANVRRYIEMGYSCLPYDYEKFDNYVSFEEIMIVYEEIADLLINDRRANGFGEILLDEIQRLRKYHGDIKIWYKGLSVGTWWDGLPSGIPFTSVVGTETNLARGAIINDLMQEAVQAGPIKSVLSIAQGDDYLDIHPSIAASLLWLHFASECRYRSNPTKFILDGERADFLRRYYSKDGVFMMPCSIVGTLCWRRREQKQDPKGMPRLNERIDIWSKASSRGLNLDYMMHDLQQCCDLKLNEIELLLKTPISYSGLGWEKFENGDSGLSMHYDETIKKGKLTSRLQTILDLAHNYDLDPDELEELYIERLGRDVKYTKTSYRVCKVITYPCFGKGYGAPLHFDHGYRENFDSITIQSYITAEIVKKVKKPNDWLKLSRYLEDEAITRWRWIHKRTSAKLVKELWRSGVKARIPNGTNLDKRYLGLYGDTWLGSTLSMLLSQRYKIGFDFYTQILAGVEKRLRGVNLAIGE